MMRLHWRRRSTAWRAPSGGRSSSPTATVRTAARRRRSGPTPSWRGGPAAGSCSTTRRRSASWARGQSGRTPTASGGGGSLRWHGVFGPHVIVGSSLAKGFGAPLAALCGSRALIDRFREQQRGPHPLQSAVGRDDPCGGTGAATQPSPRRDVAPAPARPCAATEAAAGGGRTEASRRIAVPGSVIRRRALVADCAGVPLAAPRRGSGAVDQRLRGRSRAAHLPCDHPARAGRHRRRGEDGGGRPVGRRRESAAAHEPDKGARHQAKRGDHDPIRNIPIRVISRRVRGRTTIGLRNRIRRVRAIRGRGIRAIRGRGRGAPRRWRGEAPCRRRRPGNGPCGRRPCSGWSRGRWSCSSRSSSSRSRGRWSCGSRSCRRRARGRRPCRRRSCAWWPSGRGAFGRWRLGRPANGTRWSTGRRIARPTSGDDAPRSRLAQARPLADRGAGPGGAGPSGAGPSGCGPGGCGPSGTRSGGARPGWAGSAAARPSLARSPVAASLLAGGRDLRLWR